MLKLYHANHSTCSQKLRLYFDEAPTAAIRVPSFNMAVLPRFSALDDAGLQKQQVDIRPIRKQFYERKAAPLLRAGLLPQIAPFRVPDDFPFAALSIRNIVDP